MENEMDIGNSMKNSTPRILVAALLMVIVSISCSIFSREAGADETSTPPLWFPPDALKFDPETLPAAQDGVEYEVEIHITQNSTPAGDISISSGSLPAGLEFVKVAGEDTAKISGVPTETGSFKFTVYVWCYGTNVSGQTGEKEYELSVGK